MTVRGRILTYMKRIPKWYVSRHFSNTVQELSVQTFCDLHINVPYNVNIKPLDVHKYKNSDVLRIELDGVDTRLNEVKHIQDGNKIKLFAGNQTYDQNTTCHIHAPIKANLNIEAKGSIMTGPFSGSKLVLKSSLGNILADKYEGELIDLTTEVGDIILKKPVISANITAVARHGSIKTKRIQALCAHLQANDGNIVVLSSYCDSFTIVATAANLDLQNIHKHCKLTVADGNLNLSGLDGTLEAELTNTSSDIQISRVLDDCSISMKGTGDLKLKVSDHCQQNTMFEIRAKEHTLDPTIQLLPSKNKECLYLMPKSEDYKRVLVKCENGRVDVEGASWMNMLKLKFEK